MHDEGPPTAEDGPYAGRQYERTLVENGRRIVSIDIDARLLDTIDDLRRSHRIRRGLQLDHLIRAGLASSEIAVT